MIIHTKKWGKLADGGGTYNPGFHNFIANTTHKGLDIAAGGRSRSEAKRILIQACENSNL